MSPELALAGLRFVGFTSAMLLWGAGLYLTLLVPVRLAGALSTRLRAILVAMAMLLLVASLLRLPVIAAGFGDGWGDAFNGKLLGLALRTSAGTAWLVDTAVVALLIAAQLLGRLRWPASTLLAGVFLASAALTGHAAMDAGTARLLHQLNDATHLLATGFWVGALLPLTFVLQAPVDLDMIAAVRRFAVAAQVAVAVAIVTGVTNGVLIKGGMPVGWSSPYDKTLLAKLAVVAAMVCLASLNHLRYLPRLADGSVAAARAIRRNALAEIALGLGAVGLVSILGLWDPA